VQAALKRNEEENMKTNYAAVVVSAIVYWLLGALWYGLLFNKPWMALEHMTDAQANSMNPVLPYIITFVLNLLIAFVLAQICSWRNANTAARGAAVGIFLWVGIVGPIVFTTYMYEMRSMHLFAINEFFSLVGLCLMGAILGAWTQKAA
jgi:surface polysaccharide O-acyltransferase-like enzyme